MGGRRRHRVLTPFDVDCDPLRHFLTGIVEEKRVLAPGVGVRHHASDLIIRIGLLAENLQKIHILIIFDPFAKEL